MVLCSMWLSTRGQVVEDEGGLRTLGPLPRTAMALEQFRGLEEVAEGARPPRSLDGLEDTACPVGARTRRSLCRGDTVGFAGARPRRVCIRSAEVFVEDEAQDVIAELVGVHLSA
jgi:hypothetical protein